LPGFARDAGRALANLRELARTTRNQVQEGFGTDLVGAGARLKDPRALVREFLAEADAPAAAPRPRRPRPYPTTDPEAH
jgi:hypothetical protein